MLQEVQRVYRLQGVDINDKHIEVIVRQMLKKVRVEDRGDTDFLPGTMVDVLEFNDVNAQMEAEGKEPAKGEQDVYKRQGSKRYFSESTARGIWYRCGCQSIYKRERRRAVTGCKPGGPHLHRAEEKDFCR